MSEGKWESLSMVAMFVDCKVFWELEFNAESGTNVTFALFERTMGLI